MNNEIQEIRYQVGEAWKGTYNAATTYGNANVVQDPTGLSVYRSLKPGNVGHPLTDTAWWFLIIDLSSIKEESDRIKALNDAIAADEAQRVENENGRVTAEQGRVYAETARVTAEQGRVSAEQQRVSAEQQRASQEQTRISQEQSRVTAEQGRVAAEAQRVQKEQLRENNEEQRVINETNRVAAEAERVEQYTADHQQAVADHEQYVDFLGVFDLSKHNAVGGVLATYADMSAALTALNALDSKYKYGGMSFKFVQSSDNKYVQYRLVSDSWSIDTNDWSFCGDSVYVENPEFVYVKTDKDNKILWAIRTDGSIYYGAGVPPQIIDYINEKIAELSLDEYEDIVAFLDDLEKGDKTLRQLLNERGEYIDNPEFIQVTTDSEGKIIEATRKDGKKVFYGGIEGVASEEYVNEAIEAAVPIEYKHEDATNQYLVVGKDNEGAKQHHCVAVGIDILTNNTGIKNMVVGCDSMHDCTGHDNTAMGYHSSYRNTSGNYNAAFGSESQDDNTEGSENTSIGYASMQRNNLGSLNTAVGAYALQGKGTDHFEPGNLKTFTRNVAVGANAMFDASTGSQYNIAIGYCALGSRKQYNYNIAIGEYVDCDKDGQTIIGSSHTVETMVIGDFIVKGTDGIKRRIIFNNDNTCSWEELVED